MFLILGLLLTSGFARSLKLLELRVPASVLLGSPAHLSCQWLLGPADVLYSVKWYKDGEEFFRYVPKYKDPIRKFALPDVDVENSDSSGSNVTLASASLKTSGRYRCEVSGEKPLFLTVSDHADMDVIALPDHGPMMSGLLPRYRVGNRLVVNCTSGRSQPATDLTWYINGEPVSMGVLQPQEHTRHDDGLQVTKSTLDIKVTEKNFRSNRIKIKCLATLPPFYWKSIEEESVQGKNKHTVVKHTELRNISHVIIEAHQIEANSSYQSKDLTVFFIIYSFLILYLQNN